MKRLFELIDRNLFFSKLGDFLSKEKIKQLPLITISREYGSGGSVIGKKVAENLGKQWRYFHHEIVAEIAKEAHLEKKLVREVDERKRPLIDEVISDVFGRRYIELSKYYKNLVKILSIIGNRGNAVIIGRGANYLLPHALKVRVIADLDRRIETIMQYEKLSEVQARKKVLENDKRRVEFGKGLFQHDPRKAHHYDLVIQTSQFVSVDDAVEIIVLLAKRRFNLD